MGFAWTPKATVQAAVGSMVLDRAREENLVEYIPYGIKSLTASVLSIIITAPMGAILINSLGRKWLTKADRDTVKKSECLMRESMYVQENVK